MDKVTLLQMIRGQRLSKNVGLWALNPVQFFSFGPFLNLWQEHHK